MSQPGMRVLRLLNMDFSFVDTMAKHNSKVEYLKNNSEVVLWMFIGNS